MTASHSYDSLQKIERQLAIIVPCMNEDLEVLWDVLCGIPHHCLVVVVSNSSADKHKAECAMLTAFCERRGRRALIVRQTYPRIASAFDAAGLLQILDHDSWVQ